MVLQNLLSNAVKYTPEKGQVKFNISQHNTGETVAGILVESDSVYVEVNDTGMGIPKKQQDKIFTKLFRADNVRAADTEGTGLGLYIVKSIVDHSGGRIWFNSEENKGTTFSLLLPLEGMKKKEGTKSLG